MANKSGFNASLTIGTYTGASLTDVSISISQATIDVSDLSNVWTQRAAGLKDWTISGRKNYVSQDFLTLAAAGTSMVVKVKNQAGVVIFSGVGRVSQGSLNFPMGAANESIEIQSAGTAPVLAAS